METERIEAAPLGETSGRMYDKEAHKGMMGSPEAQP